MSPFVSKAQRKMFGHLVSTGKISQATFDEWNAATGKRKLPQYIKKHQRPHGSGEFTPADIKRGYKVAK